MFFSICIIMLVMLNYMGMIDLLFFNYAILCFFVAFNTLLIPCIWCTWDAKNGMSHYNKLAWIVHFI